MDKSSIIGGIFEELGETVKKGAEQVAAKGEFAPPKTQPEAKKGNIPDVDIPALRTKEEQVKARNLAAVRQNLSQMMAPPRQQELRPQERVERGKQKEMQELEKKEGQKPPPLVVQRAQGKAEKFRGVSG